MRHQHHLSFSASRFGTRRLRQVPENFYVLPGRPIGTEIRSGPVRSSVSDRSCTDLGPDRSGENFFDDAKIFEKLDRGAAIDFVKKSSKSELSSRFLSRSKFENIARHFLANSADRPRIWANRNQIRPNPGRIG